MKANATPNIPSTNARQALLKVILAALAFPAVAMPCIGLAKSLYIDDAYAQSRNIFSSEPRGATANVFVGAPENLHDRHRATRATRQARRSDRRSFAETIGERLEPIFLGLIIL